MARIESIAIGGYYPTPSHLLPKIKEYISYPIFGTLVVDPCAGEGVAVEAISDIKSKIFACELEATRFKALKDKKFYKTIHGDAFRVEFSHRAASVLYLNPPYDYDPVKGRLEERFLERYTPILQKGGILIFIVPFYALSASIKTLTDNYENISCYRFPKKDFDSYSQVVLFAERQQIYETSNLTSNLINEWISNPENIPTLGDKGNTYIVQCMDYGGKWELINLDEGGLLEKAKIWKNQSRFSTQSLITSDPKKELFCKYSIATLPRPAHIAAGMSSGIFNGQKISSPGLPDLLVKGSFDKEFVTVDQKVDKKGKVTSVTQVQQPKLIITILNLSTLKYHTLKQESCGSKDVENFGVQDLLIHYGDSLMNVMLEQCPAIYDSRRDGESVKLAPVSRNLFKAQNHAAKAIVKLYKEKPERQGNILLGEIGSGKTTVALTVAKTIGKRILVTCPPHLLQSWKDEIKAVVPEANIFTLDNVQSVHDAVSSNNLTIALLSRETAKLGHGWEGIKGSCPKCGERVPEGDLAKTRTTCKATNIKPINEAAILVTELARLISKTTGSKTIYNSTFERRTLSHIKKSEWKGIPLQLAERIHNFILTINSYYNDLHILFSWAFPNLNFNLEYINKVLSGNYNYSRNGYLKAISLCFNKSDQQNQELINLYPEIESTRTITEESGFFYANNEKIKYENGIFKLKDAEPGSIKSAINLIKELIEYGEWETSSPCGEPLYQATPTPRRMALAGYISKCFHNKFDFLIADECHEYSSTDSAQGFAIKRLIQTGIPTLLMTGSIMNGYAKSLFQTFWNISPEFKKEFDYNSIQSFVTRYGYRKQVVSEKDMQTGEVIEYGSQTDRVVRSTRTTGDAPGVLPLLLFKYLLSMSVTLHKEDLALDLPKCTHILEKIKPTPLLNDSMNNLQKSVITALKKDRFNPDLAGKLLGALSELPSYLDRAITGVGNQEDGSYEVRYPESVGHMLVSSGRMFDPSELLPKEEWLINKLQSEIKEGRNVMIFCWHLNLINRLKTIIERKLGEKVETLYASKVSPDKRQDWIDAKIVKKKVKIMIANPVTVQTGLNNLVHFSSEIWFENPACNATIFRQAIGRVDRIGQTKETRIYQPIYEDSLQEKLHTLLLKKTVISLATDGLDPEAALQAAGATENTDNYITSLSIGRQLWLMLTEDE